MVSKKAVVLFSGGLDSTVLLYDVLGQGFEVYPIAFDYGQKHKRELLSARKTVSKLGLGFRVVDLRGFGEIVKSALTDAGINVPLEKHYEDPAQSSTVVPNRNMVMLSVAAGYASSIGAKYVFTAVQRGDYIIYGDCREEFISNMNKTLKSEDLDVEIRAPYVNMSKSDIIIIGSKLNIPYNDTWTCYVGNEMPCGKCGSCIERAEAFRIAGLNDPILD